MSFSVILNTWDTTRVQRHMTQQCISAIRKFTDEPYELIIVDNEPTMNFYHEYDVYKPYEYIEVTPKVNVYEAYNIGAKRATHDKLFFIQNDVFVHEGTLNVLSDYLDKWDIVYPIQYPFTREQVKEIQATKHLEDTPYGQRDAGLLGITREAFEKVGGWDERYHNLLGEKAFYSKCDDAGISWSDRVPAFITHIMAANNLSKDPTLYNEEMTHDVKLIEGGI